MSATTTQTIRLLACRSGKTAYRDRITAETILARIRNQSTKARRPQRTYRCPTCLLWHLTSKG